MEQTMKHFSKLILSVLLLTFLTNGIAFAQPESADNVVPTVQAVTTPEKTASQIILSIHVPACENRVFADTKFHLYSKDEVLLDSEILPFSENQSDVTLCFEVGAYTAGTEFFLLCESGAESVYFDNRSYACGEKILLTTGTYPTENPDDPGIGNTFFLNLIPRTHFPVLFTVRQQPVYFSKPVIRLENDYLVPLYAFFEAMNLNTGLIYYDEAAKKIDIFGSLFHLTAFLDSDVMLVNDTETPAPAPARLIAGELYLPFSMLGDCMGIHGNGFDFDRIHYFNLSSYIHFANETEQWMNQQQITSRTNHLIWVSKRDFTVSVFQGSQNCWDLIQQFPCTIGKPSTPTITGEFDYYSKEEKWCYPKYYVAPIMRFRGGYALHSTLIRYDGTDYDARVGHKLSLGCVRLRPNDIRWLADNIPLYTKVYITE